MGLIPSLWCLVMLSAPFCIGIIVENFGDLPTVEYNFIVVGGISHDLLKIQSLNNLLTHVQAALQAMLLPIV
jgi:hypothetical protein